MPAATWIFNVGILFANELCDGYKYAKIERLLLAPAVDAETGLEVPTWGAWLDSHGGIMPRWEILFNITVLRLISFNMDHYWAFDDRAGSPMEVRQNPIDNHSNRYSLLMLQRRNSWTQPTFPKEIESTYLPTRETIAFVITLPMKSMHRSTLQVQSLPSTIMCLS